jgi:hypothetical protein
MVTITSPDTPIFGKLNLFVENFAQMDLDGSEAGRTLVGITPGLRFDFGECDRITMRSGNAVMFGTDIRMSVADAEYMDTPPASRVESWLQPRCFAEMEVVAQCPGEGRRAC